MQMTVAELIRPTPRGTGEREATGRRAGPAGAAGWTGTRIRWSTWRENAG